MKDFEEMIYETEFTDDALEEVNDNKSNHRAIVNNLKINIVKLSNAASPWDDDPEDFDSQLVDATDILDLFTDINHALRYVGDMMEELEERSRLYYELAKSLYRQLENKEKEIEKLKSYNETLASAVAERSMEITKLKNSAKSSKIIVE